MNNCIDAYDIQTFSWRIHYNSIWLIAFFCQLSGSRPSVRRQKTRIGNSVFPGIFFRILYGSRHNFNAGKPANLLRKANSDTANTAIKIQQIPYAISQIGRSHSIKPFCLCRISLITGIH